MVSVNKFYRWVMTFVFVSSFLMMDTPVKAFSDLPKWAEREIIYLNKEGIVAGLPNGTFGSNQTITRGDAALMLAKARKLNVAPSHNESSFLDVNPEMYYYQAIEAAVNAGYLSGYPDGRFGPKDTLTREQMAKIIADAYQLKGKSGYPFTDISKSWARREIELLARNGIASGASKGKFNPKASITRAEFSVMLARVMNNQFRVKPVADAFYVPVGAKLIEKKGNERVYAYHQKLPGGGSIDKVIATPQSIFMVGKDDKGRTMFPNYLPEKNVLSFSMISSEKPNLSSSSTKKLWAIGEDFAIGYGYGSVHPYHSIYFSMIGGKGFYGSAYTDAKTFGEIIDKHNKFDTRKIKLKEINGVRMIDSFDGIKNNNTHQWKISSKGCKNGVCSQDVDLIKIDKDMEFRIMYVNPTLPKLVPELIPAGAELRGETGGSATYSYKRRLPDGATLKKVIVNKEYRTIDIVGTYSNGVKLEESYDPATGGLSVSNPDESLSANDFTSLVREVLSSFAKAYGMK